MKTKIKERMIAKLLLMRKQLSTTSIMEFAAVEATNILGKEAPLKTRHNKAIKIFKSILRYYSIRDLRYTMFPPVKGSSKNDIIETILIRSRIHRNITFHLNAASK